MSISEANAAWRRRAREREQEREHRYLPSQWSPGSVSEFVQIIGGNTLSTGQEGIVYAPSVTPAAAYDPDVDVVYPNGLGYGWLYRGRERQVNRVLVLYDDSAYQGPLLAGRPCRVLSMGTLTYVSTVMTVYRVLGW